MLLLLGLTCAGCGYRVGGQANLLPKDIHTIAVPAWGNITTQYKLPVYMAEAVSRELNSRTRYTVIADPTKADATLYASIANMFSNATVFDATTGRGTGAQIIVQIQVRLVAKDGKVLFTRPNLEFRDRYEISLNPGQYLDESQATLQRLSRDVARTVVSAILENF
ncbi:MAG: LPS assembly lipoprotein LptE [Acidobacteriota bacterium]|nr:LPS assembly lipoprotein LptE [Acidobacteriota bacterium]